MHRIELSKSVMKFLRNHPDVINSFVEQSNTLAIDPYNSKLDRKPLKGKWWPFRRLRIGKYRFLYKVQEESIVVFFFHAGSRGDVYKK